MPPWPPGFNDELSFKQERRLPDQDIALIRRWLEEGAVEGNLADLPPAPEFPDGWKLGEPDLVVASPAPYSLPPGGEDVYRNLVLPIPIDQARWVSAIEILLRRWCRKSGSKAQDSAEQSVRSREAVPHHFRADHDRARGTKLPRG